MAHFYSGKILGQLETEVMEVIWQTGKPVMVRDVHETLGKRRKIAYTTVMTIMGRLKEKGLLRAKQSGKAYAYSPAYSKEKFLVKTTQSMVRNLVSIFGDSAVTNFADELEKLSPEKKDTLLKLLKEAQKP